MKHTQRSGFTLIELLVVIAIIAILAAILFPVFAQAREKARQAACLSNEKQIGLGVMQYVQDYDETFPERYGDTNNPADFANGKPRSWKDMIYPYIKSRDVFRCPSNPTAQKPDRIYSNNVQVDGNFPGGYAMWLPDAFLSSKFGHGAGYPQTLAGLQQAASSLLILEHSYVFPDTGPYLQYNEPARDSNATPGPSEWNSGHDKKAGNIIYMDGHVKWRHLIDTFQENNGINEWRYNKAQD